MRWKIFIVISCIFLTLKAFSQSPITVTNNEDIYGFIQNDSSRKILVTAVHITGNRQTRDYIIEREMLFKQGDSIAAGNLFRLLDESRKLIYNTTLFTSVELKPSLVTNNQITINVTVHEKWYIYPTPQFQVIARNFNEWLKVYNGDLNRVVYGAKFAHYNFTGRRDQLRIYLLTGYARNISFSYASPYSNPALTEGFSIGAAYTENREVSYKTSYSNKQFLYTNESFVRTVIAASGSYQIRKGHYRSHIFNIGYSNIKVIDTLLSPAFNPGYFNSSSHIQNIPDISYIHVYTNVDNVSYPLLGTTRSYTLLKRGLQLTGGINAFIIDAQLSHYFTYNHNWYSSIQLMTDIKFPFTQAYINRRSFGFGDYYLRGLEYYVVDGVASALTKITIKKKVLDFQIKTPFHFKVVPYIPFKIFIKTFADAGYAYNQKQFQASLNNRLLYTGGFGIDILTLYDLNLRIEYSFNQLNENGLFLRTKGGF